MEVKTRANTLFDFCRLFFFAFSSTRSEQIIIAIDAPSFFIPQIEGADYDRLAQDAYGARVLVSQSSAGDRGFQGGARLTNVEFYHTGQHGFNLPWDPRMSLAFLHVDTEYVNRSEQYL